MENDKTKIEPIPEYEADTTRTCEIRFDCLVTMHDVGYKHYKGGLFVPSKVSKTPQWFRANNKLTLEAIKYMDEYTIGSVIKRMFYELENTIKQYEQPR